MEQQSIITDIEERAKSLGFTMEEVCKGAGLHPTTFSRWKRSERNPNPIGATLASLGKIDAFLVNHERASAA